MKTPRLLLVVRFRSRLPFERVMEIVEARAPEFEALEGLLQKYYVHDPATGEIAGVYVWASEEALDAYRRSELRGSIAAAYEAEGEPRVEVLPVVKVLR